jgi:uncharacterized protein (TIGR03066 family)
MYFVRVLLALGLVVCVAVGAGAQSKTKPKDKDAAIDKGKMPGTWVVTEPGPGTGAGDKGTTYEFTKDGKATVSSGKKKGLSGTYKLDGQTLTWKVGAAGAAVESPPFKVTKLTDKEMTLEDVTGGKITLSKK